jgi:hypothetical protein
MDEKFTVGDPKCKPLKFFLPALSNIITSNGLDQEAAYILLLSITKEDTNFHVRQAMYEDHIPFEETWINLQKTCSRSSSMDGLQKELEELFKRHPTDLEGTLGRIQTLRAKMFASYPDEHLKKIFTVQSTTQDFFNLIHTFYPSQAGRIESAFDSKMESYQVEKELRERQGRPETHKPNEINILKEIICSFLSRPFGITAGPSRLFGGADTSFSSPSKGRAEMHSIEVSSAAVAGSTHNSNNSNVSTESQKRKNFNKAGYNKNPNIGAQTFYNSTPPVQPAPVYQQNPNMNQTQPQFQQQSAQNMTQMAPQMVPQMAMQQANQAQAAYDPGAAQEAYLNRGALMVPRECIEAIGRDNCFLCYGRGHWLSNCPIYPGETPTSKQCPSCLAFHPSACKGVGPSTDAGLAPARNFIPGQMNYRNGYVNNNRYNNNNRQQMNGYNGNNNYNNRMGGGQRPYNNQNNNQNYQNRGPRNYGQNGGGYRGPRDYRPPGQQGYQQGYDQNQNQQPMQPAQQMQPMSNQMNQQPSPPMMQPQNANPGYMNAQQPKAGVIGNHGIQPAPEGVYMNMMQAQNPIQTQPLMQNHQPLGLY